MDSATFTDLVHFKFKFTDVLDVKTGREKHRLRSKGTISGLIISGKITYLSTRKRRHTPKNIDAEWINRKNEKKKNYQQKNRTERNRGSGCVQEAARDCRCERSKVWARGLFCFTLFGSRRQQAGPPSRWMLRRWMAWQEAHDTSLLLSPPPPPLRLICNSSSLPPSPPLDALSLPAVNNSPFVSFFQQGKNTKKKNIHIYITYIITIW